MHRVLLKDNKDHVLPYAFWLSPVFEEYFVPIQVWSFQTTKYVIGTMNYMFLLASMRHPDNPLQCLRNALAEKDAEL